MYLSVKFAFSTSRPLIVKAGRRDSEVGTVDGIDYIDKRFFFLLNFGW